MGTRRRAHQGRLPDPRSARCNGKRLVYLDSASSSQKPLAVLDAMDRYYRDVLRQRPPRRLHDRRGGHRGVRGRARARSRRFVDARDRARDRLRRATPPRRSTSSPTRGPAPTCARATRSCSPQMEHHANVVPWHILAAERGVELRWIPLTADYRLDLTDLDRAARRRQAASPSPRCRTCSAPINDIRPLADAAHAAGAHVLVDACQAVPAPRRRRAGVGRRLRRLHRPQDAAARPASARSGPAASCSRRCRRSSAAAR